MHMDYFFKRIGIPGFGHINDMVDANLIVGADDFVDVDLVTKGKTPARADFLEWHGDGARKVNVTIPKTWGPRFFPLHYMWGRYYLLIITQSALQYADDPISYIFLFRRLKDGRLKEISPSGRAFERYARASVNMLALAR